MKRRCVMDDCCNYIDTGRPETYKKLLDRSIVRYACSANCMWAFYRGRHEKGGSDDNT